MASPPPPPPVLRAAFGGGPPHPALSLPRPEGSRPQSHSSGTTKQPAAGPETRPPTRRREVALALLRVWPKAQGLCSFRTCWRSACGSLVKLGAPGGPWVPEIPG